MIAELASRLGRRGHGLTMVRIGSDPLPFPVDPSVEVISLKGCNRGPAGYRRLADAYLLWTNMPKQAEIVVSTYYLSAYFGCLAAWSRRAKHIYFIQGYEPDFFDKKDKLVLLKKTLALMTYLLPGRLVTISSWVRSQIQNHTLRSIKVVNDGVDIEVFNPGGKSLDGNKRPIIATMAWGERRKGFYDFVKSIEQIREYRKDFEVKIVSSDRNIVITASFPYSIEFPAADKELAGWYRQAMVFVSASHLEGFGLPVLEAMACGIPVVTTSSGGVSDFAVHGVNCLMVPVGDPKALAGAIDQLLDDPDLRKRLALQGLETARSLSWEHMIVEFEKCLQ